MTRVFDAIPGQEPAISFLRHAVDRPHHAYVFAGPEGGGKRLAMHAFAAALVCSEGGCGACRSCWLVLEDAHPNVVVVEPEGAEIHVDTVRQEVWHRAYRTAPEPGRKVFLIREADRLSPAAADALLKVLEEPPPDAILVLSSARPGELPPTVASRCHTVTFQPLAEDLVVAALVETGIQQDRARLAARLTGGNLGRARRLARDEDGLAFRDTARQALELAESGVKGAVEAAELVVSAAKDYKRGLSGERERELRPWLGADGRPDEAARGEVRRVEQRYHRRERRAERDYLDWVLLACSSLLRDRLLAGIGGDPAWRINLDLEPERGEVSDVVRGIAAVEQARAALADESNLNARLVLERAFLAVAPHR